MCVNVYKHKFACTNVTPKKERKKKRNGVHFTPHVQVIKFILGHMGYADAVGLTWLLTVSFFTSYTALIIIMIMMMMMMTVTMTMTTH